MDAADLRVFQSVARTGSMNKAALELPFAARAARLLDDAKRAVADQGS